MRDVWDVAAFVCNSFSPLWAYSFWDGSVHRFWDKVDKSGSCWIWTGSRLKTGYGRFHFAGKTITAHRVSWMMAHGSIDEGMHVLHKCDNPPCVNPDHLYLGTHTQNMQDKRRSQ